VTSTEARGKVEMKMQDGMLHLQWKARPSGAMDARDDLILFPGDATFEHVPECTTGRVYLLRFKSSNIKRFFWMQEREFFLLFVCQLFVCLLQLSRAPCFA
jgi:hypothetical protein